MDGLGGVDSYLDINVGIDHISAGAAAKFVASAQLGTVPFEMAEAIGVARYFDLVSQDVPREDWNAVVASRFTTAAPVHWLTPATPLSREYYMFDVNVVEQPDAKFCIVSAD